VQILLEAARGIKQQNEYFDLRSIKFVTVESASSRMLSDKLVNRIPFGGSQIDASALGTSHESKQKVARLSVAVHWYAAVVSVDGFHEFEARFVDKVLLG